MLSPTLAACAAPTSPCAPRSSRRRCSIPRSTDPGRLVHRARRGAGRQRTLPPKAVVITFDDGRLNQYTNAIPVLKLGFTATFFPFTHAMDRNPRYFTWAQFKELQQAGHTIGSHTSLHVRVDKMKDAKQMHTEVTGSREQLQAKLGATATEYFSYPFGALAAAGDSAVRAAGYRAARAYTGGPWNSIRDRWRLKAVPMTENMKRFAQVVDPSAAAELPATATRSRSSCGSPCRPSDTSACRRRSGSRPHGSCRRPHAWR
ncbi:MAG: polysaccharide deacetylase family protein [Gemmatimonadetes bacterium]|nr:polysaccharide deacetylase family protein [Gemmatimonadota bacterium]